MTRCLNRRNGWRTHTKRRVRTFSTVTAAAMQTRNENLRAGAGDFSAYRKSYSFGEDNWLTVETYAAARDSETPPETGGRFIINGDSKAVMVCESHTDAAIIGSTNPLPLHLPAGGYRVEYRRGRQRPGRERQGCLYQFMEGLVHGKPQPLCGL